VGSLKLPKDADAAFRIEATDEFDNRFALNAYGSVRSGWFVANHRYEGPDQDSGFVPLPKGEWAMLLHFIDQCGFWKLPEDGSHLTDKARVVFGGEWLTITGRDAERYHRVHRFVWREPGLDAVLAFAQRVSGFFVRHPITGRWLLPDLDQVMIPQSHSTNTPQINNGG
jgi:hypothetical protein